MRIAVTARENSLDSPFVFRFCRARGFILFNTDSQHIAYLDNTDGQGPDLSAVVETVRIITHHGVQALITGSIGPRASKVLAATSIRVFPYHGETVRKALQAYQNGLLPYLRPVGSRSASPDI